MARLIIWHGDATTAIELRQVIQNNCTCEIDEQGRTVKSCPAHQALLDQRFLNGLVFGRTLVQQMLREEFG